MVKVEENSGIVMGVTSSMSVEISQMRVEEETCVPGPSPQ